MQDKTDTFYEILGDQINRHFPLKKVRSSTNDKPWMNNKIRSLIQKRQHAFIKGHTLLWKYLRNSVNCEIIRARTTFTAKKLTQIDPKNPSTWYSTVKQICGMNNKVSKVVIPGYENSPSSDFAKAVNDHFGRICSSLPALDLAQLPAYLPATTVAPSVTRSQVWRELSHIKVRKAPGPDGLPNRILKEFAFEISEVLCNIINASLFQGLVPSQWKCAVIVPLPKMIPTPSLDKLRPVSLTSTLAKVTETFISKWMIQNMSQSLDSQQFGNRKGRSTSHYLVQLVQHIHQAWEDGLTANLLAVYYSKAFDRVDITVAIQKLIHMGVSSALIPWISDFLTDRKQCVRVNGATSEWYSVTCGVPQGTKVVSWLW